MGRTPCCEKYEVMNKGSWSAWEDRILENYVKVHGEGKWRDVPKRAGLNRCGKSCRQRWLNYLRPGIKRGNISEDEEELIIKLHKLLGNRWALIAGRLPGRTDIEIKNYWNSCLSKRLRQQQTQQSHDNSRVIATTQTKISSLESPVSVIRTKASKFTKVVLPMQAAMDLDKLVNSYHHSKDAENEMNLVRGGTENQSFTEDFSRLLIDFGIGDLLGPDDLAAQPGSGGKKKGEMNEQYCCGNNTVDRRDPNGQSEFFQPKEAEVDLSFFLNLD